MSLQDVYVAHLLRHNLDPTTSLETDWQRWQKEIKKRESDYIVWLTEVRTAISSSKAESLQIDKFTEKFKTSLQEFNSLFQSDPILKALRDVWIPQISSRFHLKYDLQLELEELSEKSSSRISKLNTEADEADSTALSQETINHSDNVTSFSTKLLSFLEDKVQQVPLSHSSSSVLTELRTRLIEEIKEALQGLKKLSNFLSQIKKDLELFQNAKLQLWEDTQQNSEKLKELQNVEFPKEPLAWTKEKHLRERLAKWEENTTVKYEEKEDEIKPQIRKTAETIDHLFQRANIKMLKERIRVEVSSYKLRKTEWISSLELLLWSIVSLLMEAKLSKMTVTAYTSGFQENFKKQQELQKLSKLQSDLEQADFEFEEQKQRIKKEASEALKQYSASMEQFRKLLEKSREQARKGLEEIVILSGLNDSKKWKWTKTSSAQDFALNLVRTLASNTGDASAYRIKKIPLETASPDPLCLAKFSDNPEENKYNPRQYQVMIGLLGDAEIDVRSLFLLHKMGSGKSLTFSEFLVKYIHTSGGRRRTKQQSSQIVVNQSSRNALILVPQITNMNTWKRELIDIRFRKDDIQTKYAVEAKQGSGAVAIILKDKEGKQSPFLILITVFSRHLKKSASFVRDVILEVDQEDQWTNLEELSEVSGESIVTGFYENGVEQLYKNNPPLQSFDPWSVAPKEKNDFVVPEYGVICIDEIQNMANPKDLSKQGQEAAMTWALAVHLANGRKVALTGTPALDFSRPLDIFKAFNIITTENTFLSGVWIAPLRKDEREQNWDKEREMASIETKYLVDTVLKDPQSFSQRYYTRLLVSYIDLDNDPTTYARIQNTCRFPELSDSRTQSSESEEAKCEEIITVDSKMKATRKANSETTKQFIYNFWPKGGLDAVRVLVFPSGTKKLLSSKQESGPVKMKFLAIQEIILSLPKEKHFVFLDARLYKDGTQNTLVPLLDGSQKGLWKIPVYKINEAIEWLKGIWEAPDFWKERKTTLDMWRTTLNDAEKVKSIEADDLKRIQRKLNFGKDPTSTQNFADIWYDQHRSSGQTSKRMLPLTYMQNSQEEKKLLTNLYTYFQKFQKTIPKFKQTDEDKEEVEDEEKEIATKADKAEQQASIARAFLFNFYIDLWNHPENDQGAYFSTLLGDIQTKEGLSFLTTRCVHFVKVPKTRSMWLQVLARLLRLCSMTRAYSEIRDWVIKVFLYLWADKEADFSDTARKSGKTSKDVKDFERLQQVITTPEGNLEVKKSEIESLLEILQRNAIDCTFFAEYNFGLSSDSDEDKQKLEKLCRLPYHRAQEQLREDFALKKGKTIKVFECSNGNWWLENVDGKTLNISSVSLSSEALPYSSPDCDNKEYLTENLTLYNQADETLLQLLSEWLSVTELHPSLGKEEKESKSLSFIESLMKHKMRLIGEGSISKENSHKLVKTLILTTENQIDRLFSQMNSLLVEDQSILLKFLISKKALNLSNELVPLNIIETYQNIAKSAVTTFFKRFDVLTKYEVAKRDVRKLPSLPSGGTFETGITYPKKWEYIPPETIGTTDQSSSELAAMFPSD
jgi:hypothetical protein